jgi:hypothetical protein
MIITTETVSESIIENESSLDLAGYQLFSAAQIQPTALSGANMLPPFLGASDSNQSRYIHLIEIPKNNDARSIPERPRLEMPESQFLAKLLNSQPASLQSHLLVREGFLVVKQGSWVSCPS